MDVWLVHLYFHRGFAGVVHVHQRGVELGVCRLAGLEGRPGRSGDGGVGLDVAEMGGLRQGKA